MNVEPSADEGTGAGRGSAAAEGREGFEEGRPLSGGGRKSVARSESLCVGPSRCKFVVNGTIKAM